jgi:hypothetical protein
LDYCGDPEGFIQVLQEQAGFAASVRLALMARIGKWTILSPLLDSFAPPLRSKM